MTIAVQTPKAVKYEKSFPDMYPVTKKSFNQRDVKELAFNFTGTGFVLNGEARKKNNDAADYVWPESFVKVKNLMWKKMLWHQGKRLKTGLSLLFSVALKLE